MTEYREGYIDATNDAVNNLEDAITELEIDMSDLVEEFSYRQDRSLYERTHEEK